MCQISVAAFCKSSHCTMYNVYKVEFIIEVLNNFMMETKYLYVYIYHHICLNVQRVYKSPLPQNEIFRYVFLIYLIQKTDRNDARLLQEYQLVLILQILFIVLCIVYKHVKYGKLQISTIVISLQRIPNSIRLNYYTSYIIFIIECKCLSQTTRKKKIRIHFSRKKIVRHSE